MLHIEQRKAGSLLIFFFLFLLFKPEKLAGMAVTIADIYCVSCEELPQGNQQSSQPLSSCTHPMFPTVDQAMEPISWKMRVSGGRRGKNFEVAVWKEGKKLK
ncbi:hypothetical protein QR685DRAFT_591002 [Neurospora intermedia]|uniref:Uncharacterized protein n=1 Tax=Neurospora intermedia TaxID=5142 RepID=A0ABR3D6V6_NEUIN